MRGDLDSFYKQSDSIPAGNMVFTVEFPYFGFPVLFEQESYGTAVRHGVDSFPRGVQSWTQNLVAVDDPELDASNPVENKYRKLAKDLLRGLIDIDLKPNKMEREDIGRIIASPNYVLKDHEKDLLWKFRFSLTDNNKALTKFLLCVDWEDEEEEKQANTLLDQWAPIDTADALKLLGREREFQNNVVRSFAVSTLKRAPDDELLDYLLQLVQAIRYEPDAGPGSGSEPSPIARFLVQRAMHNFHLANYLYWYLKVELDAPDAEPTKHGAMYGSVFKFFSHSMHHDEQGMKVYKLIKAQDAYVTEIADAQKKAREEKGRKDAKEEKLRKVNYIRCTAARKSVNLTAARICSAPAHRCGRHSPWRVRSFASRPHR